MLSYSIRIFFFSVLIVPILALAVGRAAHSPFSTDAYPAEMVPVKALVVLDTGECYGPMTIGEATSFTEAHPKALMHVEGKPEYRMYVWDCQSPKHADNSGCGDFVPEGKVLDASIKDEEDPEQVCWKTLPGDLHSTTVLAGMD